MERNETRCEGCSAEKAPGACWQCGLTYDQVLLVAARKRLQAAEHEAKLRNLDR